MHKQRAALHTPVNIPAQANTQLKNAVPWAQRVKNLWQRSCPFSHYGTHEGRTVEAKTALGSVYDHASWNSFLLIYSSCFTHFLIVHLDFDDSFSPSFTWHFLLFSFFFSRLQAFLLIHLRIYIRWVYFYIRQQYTSVSTLGRRKCIVDNNNNTYKNNDDIDDDDIVS